MTTIAGTVVPLGIGSHTVFRPVGWAEITVEGLAVFGFVEPRRDGFAANVTIGLRDGPDVPEAVYTPGAFVIEDLEMPDRRWQRSLASVHTISDVSIVHWECWIALDEQVNAIVTSSCEASRLEALLPTFHAVVRSVLGGQA